jgi:hypothetical protein
MKGGQRDDKVGKKEKGLKLFNNGSTQKAWDNRGRKG